MSSDYHLETLEIISNVKFDKLSPKQAQEIGFKLAIVGETLDHKNCTLHALRAAVSAFAAATIGGITLHIFDQQHALHGVLGGLMICVGVEAMNFWRSTQIAAAAADELNADIERLRELP